MSAKKRLTISDEQLTLIDMEPVPPKKLGRLRVPKRVANLEERVTRLEGEVTLIRGQMERDEDDD